MRTLVLSDLHLGNDSGYDIFSGGRELEALLLQHSDCPTRVVFNGDTVDFLMNTDPLEIDTARAVSQARAITAAPDTAASFRALGHLLAAGGEAVIRLGNHDLELALRAVQEIFREALQQPADIAQRLSFQLGDAPMLLEASGNRILIAHGDHADRWNRVDYAHLPDIQGNPPETPGNFSYPGGSVLVKKLLNPLKRDYGMRFADLLKPDFQGAVLTSLAVNPGAVKLLFSRTPFQILHQLFRTGRSGMPFDPMQGAEEPDLGLAARVDEAGLSQRERDRLTALLDPQSVSFDLGAPPPLDSGRLKLGRAGLTLYARLQRHAVGSAGQAYFELEPDEDEQREATRLAQKFQAQAVLLGHTHSARWLERDGLLYANTGTWIWLMRLPHQQASDETWMAYLTELQQNPELLPEHQKLARLEQRLSFVLIEPQAANGAVLSLREWHPGKGSVVIRSSTLPPAA